MRQYDDYEDRIEVKVLSHRRHISRRGTAWCGTNRAGHFIQKGTPYEITVSIVDGEFDVWCMCMDCEYNLLGEGVPAERLYPRPKKDQG